MIHNGMLMSLFNLSLLQGNLLQMIFGIESFRLLQDSEKINKKIYTNMQLKDYIGNIYI